MTITWEALGAVVGLIAGIVAANLFITRAIVRQELDKFQKNFRPIGECELVHKAVNGRLDRLEVPEEKDI